MGEQTTTPGEPTPTPAPAAAVENTGTPAPADATPDTPPAPAAPPVNQAPIEPPIRQVPPPPDAPNSEKAAFRVENKGQPTTPPPSPAPATDSPTAHFNEMNQFGEKIDALTGVVQQTLERQQKIENHQQIETQINADIDKFLVDNPAYKEVTPQVKSWANHEAYSKIPIEQIFYQAAGKDNARLGAESAKMLADKANEATTAPGQPSPASKPKTDYASMTKEEFAKAQGQVMAKEQEVIVN